MNSSKVLVAAVTTGGFMAGLSAFDSTVYANSEATVGAFNATRQGRTDVNLNMRAGAGASHRIIRTLPRNTSFTILSESNGWMRVRVGTQEGWVSAQFVTVTSGNNSSSGSSAATRAGRTNANLNMRAGAGTNHRILRTLPSNTNVTILSESNGWMRVRVGTQEGWVSSQFVTVTNGNNNSNTGGGTSTATREGRTSGNLNMRVGAGTNHRVLRTLPRNTNVTILSESNGWMRIRVGTQEGWVSAQFVTVTNGNNNSNAGGSTTPTTGEGRTTANVNKRAGAGTNHRILRTLGRNTNVTILSESGGWTRVRVGTQEGWVSSQFITTASGSTNNNTNNSNNSNNTVGGDRWNITSRFNITPVSASNRGRFMDAISNASTRHGVPISVIQRMIEVESSFNNNAVSRVGARGLMQLMPATASALGVSNPHDPFQNIEAGTRYLSQHLNTFNGDLVLALAAYNAGIGNVRRHGGVPPFTETINYIQRITGINVRRTMLAGVDIIDMPESADSDAEFFEVDEMVGENIEFESDAIVIADVEPENSTADEVEMTDTEDIVVVNEVAMIETEVEENLAENTRITDEAVAESVGLEFE